MLTIPIFCLVIALGLSAVALVNAPRSLSTWALFLMALGVCWPLLPKATPLDVPRPLTLVVVLLAAIVIGFVLHERKRNP